MAAIIGTAGWAIPAAVRDRFAGEGTALQRYASVLRGVEVNSSFHRPHRRATWERWADSVPGDFRFAVKLPKTITHQRKLHDCDAEVARFLAEVAGLGPKLAILLVQLPPKLTFDPPICAPFFSALIAQTPARVVCEPRHPSWFDDAADALLDELEIARVAADPALVPAAARPGGWRGLTYLRLHGSPQMYRSSYPNDRLRAYAAAIAAEAAAGRPCWCMFDNTAASAALPDTLALAALLAA